MFSVKTILENRDYTKSLGYSKLPQPGQFVSTGMQAGNNIIKMVGYCVPLRRNIGMFGSDLYLIRHADRILTIHENQSFYSITEEQEALLRPHFKILPEQEDYTGAYCLQRGSYPEIGFLVEKKTMLDIPPTTINDIPLKITQIDSSGNKIVMVII